MTVILRYSKADRADQYVCIWRRQRADACGWDSWTDEFEASAEIERRGHLDFTQRVQALASEPWFGKPGYNEPGAQRHSKRPVHD